MRLRNKKTGGIYEADYMLGINVITELSEDWEVYKPTEPLIKDEKIRKAVRAWAEALYLRGAIFDFNDETMMLRGEKLKAYISFDGLDFCEFKHVTAEYHTIAELCGEEEG